MLLYWKKHCKVHKVQILISLDIGRGNVALDSRRWLCKRWMHLSTGMLVYRDLMSKLAKYLLFISMSVYLLMSVIPNFLCVSLMVLNRGDNNMARGLTISWGKADPIPEIKGLSGMSGWWVLGRP